MYLTDDQIREERNNLYHRLEEAKCLADWSGDTDPRSDIAQIQLAASEMYRDILYFLDRWDDSIEEQLHNMQIQMNEAEDQNDILSRKLDRIEEFVKHQKSLDRVTEIIEQDY